MELSESLIVSIVTLVLSVPGAWYAAKASQRKASADLMGAVDNRVTLLMQAQADEIKRLRSRVDDLEEALATSRQTEKRLHGLLRRVLTALNKHDPDAAKQIRDDNQDLEL